MDTAWQQPARQNDIFWVRFSPVVVVRTEEFVVNKM